MADTGSGQAEAKRVIKSLKSEFERHYPKFTYQINDDADMDAVELFIEDENDEPTYASTASIIYGYDGTVSIDVNWQHSSSSVEYDRVSSASELFRKAEAYIKKVTDMIPKKASEVVTAFENTLLAEQVASRIAKQWPSDEAKQKYLREHPDADPSKHWVKGEKDKEEVRKDKYKRDSDLINRKIDKSEESKSKKEDQAKKREEKRNKDDAAENKRIDKERAWADGKEDRDRKKKEKYDKDVAKRNKELDKKEDSERKKREKTAAETFEDALLAEKIAARYAGSQGE